MLSTYRAIMCSWCCRRLAAAPPLLYVLRSMPFFFFVFFFAVFAAGSEDSNIDLVLPPRRRRSSGLVSLAILQSAGLEGSDIDLIILASSSPDDLFGDATTVAAAIGASAALLHFAMSNKQLVMLPRAMRPIEGWLKVVLRRSRHPLDRLSTRI